MASAAPTTVAARPERLHLDHVEGLRAAAALVVYVNHAYAQVWHPGAEQFPTGWWSSFSYALVAGHLSVTVFIVISGFCLALPVVNNGGVMRDGPLAFIKRRARRILPPYYGALALSLLLIWTIIGEPTGTLWDVPIQVNEVALISHLVLLQDIFGTGRINYVFWSIAVEWHIYFLFPLLVLSWRRFGPGLTVALAMVIGYALRIGFDESRLARANPQFIGMFALGMLAAFAARSSEPRYVKLRQTSLWSFVAAGCLVVVVALSLYWGFLEATRQFFILDAFMGLFAFSVLLITSRPSPSPLTRVLAWRPLATIGVFSYSVYLIHAPLLQILWQYVLNPAGFSSNVRFVLLMSVGLALVLGASYLFYKVFEQPFMTRRKPAEENARPSPVAS